MGFLASMYAELKCRICKKSFCCNDCRSRHEMNAHGVDPDCEICIKGNIPISRVHVSSELLMHIKQQHWPLHCIFCPQTYTTTYELENHTSACLQRPLKSEKLSTKTPMRMQPQADDFESPPIVSINGCNNMAITSTPMNPEVKSGISVPDHITPVDSDRLQIKKEQSTCTDNAIDTSKNKRRVTFVSTPAVESVRRKPLTHENFLKAALKSSLRSNESTQYSLPSYSIERSNSCYSTAPEKSSSDMIEQLKNETIELKLHASMKKTTITRKRRSYSMNETLWETAINETIALQEITSEVLIVENRQHNLLLDVNKKKSSSFSESIECYSVQDTGTDCSTPTPKTGVWSSMTSMFRNMVQGLHPRQGAKLRVLNASLKRHRSFADCDMEFDEQRQKMKRIKLCDVKCRPPIRMNNFAKFVSKVDKSIQTDSFVE